MLAIGSDNLLTLAGLFDAVGSAYVDSNVTVTGRLMTAAGVVILSSFALGYVNASNGNYTGSIPASTAATLTAGAAYIVRITATTTGGNVLILDLHEQADYALSN